VLVKIAITADVHLGIKKDYPKSAEAASIDKYIERAIASQK